MRRNRISLLVVVLLVLVHSASFAQAPASEPFPQRQMTLANGVKGENVKFNSGNPPTYASIVAGEVPPSLAVDAKLFLPHGQGPFPAVIIVPGSGGVTPGNLDAANTLTSTGIAALIVDPFHSFDRANLPLTEVPNAVKALLAPISYINNKGIFFDYRSGRYDPAYNDVAMVDHAITSGFLEKGARFGSRPGDPEAFRQDMVDFFVRTLKD